tara:strand:- start:391 stop:639 length:249 start_codon:yes stop_codon:yes gene_type:complete
MKILKLILFFTFFLNCQKQDDCIIIIQKKNIDEKFYFLFESENITNNFSNPDSTNIPDKFSSGEVDIQTYQKYSIGEVYCNN